MFAAVGAVAEDEAVVVAGPLQGGGHLLVGEGPVAEFPVQVVGAALQEDADRLAGSFADQRGVIKESGPSTYSASGSTGVCGRSVMASTPLH